MVKIIQVCLVLLGSFLMGAVTWFIDDVSVIDAVSASYFAIINIYLGVDVAGMITSSSKLPVGEYKNMKFSRYVLAFIFMIVLFGMTLYRKEVDGVNAVMAMSSFSAGAMLVLGFVIGGLQGNKIATKAGDSE